MLKDLITDPPLIRRLTWQDPIRSDALISEDRGLMARTFGTGFLVGGIVAAVGAVVADTTARGEETLVVLGVVDLAVAAICFVVYRRLPIWFFQLCTLLGVAIVTVAVNDSSSGAEGVYVLFYVWAVLLAGLFFTVRFAFLTTAAAVAAFWVVLEDRNIDFTVSWLTAMLAVLGTSGVMTVLLRSRMEQMAGTLAGEAHTDTLTGLPNRRAFDDRFQEESDRSARSGMVFSIGICDLDHFKKVNDLLGHQEGDEVLKRTAAAITEGVRSIDFVSRLGGEEFGVILPNSTAGEARLVAERIRTAVGREFADAPVALTISCGVATYGADGEGRRLFRSADLALYRAKELGRNRTVTFGEDPTLVESSAK